MDIQVEGNKQKTRLVCSGNATVEASAEIRDTLIDALQNSKKVVLDVAGIKKTDVSFLQLLVSAEKTARTEKKVIEIDPETYSEALIQTAVKAGYCQEQEHSGNETIHTLLATYRARIRQEARDV